jgi:FkbM family methyltransferase
VTTVIDVGCARIGGDYSIERLIEMFQPSKLFGFDPGWEPGMFTGWAGIKTLVTASREAAWTRDGTIGYRADGLNSWVTDDRAAPRVPCFDLARFIDDLPGGPVILKLDCEGAEFDLLEHLIERNVDARLDRLLVEWHPIGEGKRRHAIEMALTCPYEQWRW